MSVLLITRSVGAIPLALLERNIDFRSRSVCELTGAVGQAGVSLGLAVTGFGVWSIVLGQIVGSALESMLAWAVTPVHPDPRNASIGVVRDLVRYGRNVSGTNILNIANNTVDNVVIGRVLGATALGFYAVAFRLADFPNTVIAHIVGRVMFPVYSLLQDELARFRRAFIQNLQRIAVLALPVSVTILVCAEPIVLGLFGAKWEPAVAPLRILAAYGLVKSFTSPAGEVFKGAGRPELGLAVGTLQIAIVVPALVVLVRSQGIDGAALAMLIAISACGIVKLALALRLLQGTALGLARALAPSFLCSAVLCATLLLLMSATDGLGPVVRLSVLGAGGAAVYVAATLAFARSVVVPMWVGLRGADAAR
jgi:O-antigen/teichoic acid export membrane protein